MQGIDKEVKKGSRLALWEAVKDTYTVYVPPSLPLRGTPAVTPRFKLQSLPEDAESPVGGGFPRKQLLFE